MESLTISAELNSALRAEYGRNATDAQWTIFIEFCKLRNLLPGRDVVLQIHSANEYDSVAQTNVRVKKASYVTTIGALQTIAERSGTYLGREQTVYTIVTKEGELRDSLIPYVKDDEKFFGALVTVMRKDRPKTVFFARLDAYVATYYKNGVENVGAMWKKRGPEQTAKCAFAGALREAFPEDLAGLYSNEEMERVSNVESEPSPVSTWGASEALTILPKPVQPPMMSTEPARVEGNKPLETPFTEFTAPKVAEPGDGGARLAQAIESEKSALTTDLTPTEAQLAAREALKKVPAEKLAAFDAIVPDAKATFQPLPKEQSATGTTESKSATSAPATPSTTEASQSKTESAPSTTPTDKPASSEPLDKIGRDKQYARATEFCANVLTPEPPKGGGMKASKGNTVTAKLKKFFLSQTTKGTDLAALTLEQWEMTWIVLDARLREYGPEKLVAYIESKI